MDTVPGAGTGRGPRAELGGPTITDAGLAHVAGLTKLNQLVILRCPGVKGPGLAHLKGMTALDRLVLYGSGVTDLSVLPVLPNLRVIVLEGLPIGDAGIARVADLPGLTALVLTNTQVGDAGLNYLAGRDLTELGLSGTKITDAALDCLGCLPRLETLDISRTAITDAGLARFVQLRAIGLAVRAMTRSPIAFLRAMRAQVLRGRVPRFRGIDTLESLDVSYTKITDASLPILLSMRRVSKFNLEGTAITPAGLAAFKAALRHSSVRP